MRSYVSLPFCFRTGQEFRLGGASGNNCFPQHATMGRLKP